VVDKFQLITANPLMYSWRLRYVRLYGS